MLAITTPKSQSPKKTVIPNILPCKITHSGPIPTSTRHWNPQSTSSTSLSSTDDTQQTAYFRGRKLQGAILQLPEGYTGKVLSKTDTLLPQAPTGLGTTQDEEEDEEIPAEIKEVEELGTFEKVVVWGHERFPVEGEDVYVQGLREWIGFAEKIHAYDTPASTMAATTT